MWQPTAYFENATYVWWCLDLVNRAFASHIGCSMHGLKECLKDKNINDIMNAQMAVGIDVMSGFFPVADNYFLKGDVLNHLQNNKTSLWKQNIINKGSKQTVHLSWEIKSRRLSSTFSLSSSPSLSSLETSLLAYYLDHHRCCCLHTWWDTLMIYSNWF